MTWFKPKKGKITWHEKKDKGKVLTSSKIKNWEISRWEMPSQVLKSTITVNYNKNSLLLSNKHNREINNNFLLNRKVYTNSKYVGN
jgi:hypothetical protein